MVRVVPLGHRLLPELALMRELKTHRKRLALALAHPNGLFIDKYKEELFTYLWEGGEDVDREMSAADLIEHADQLIKAHNYA